MVDVMSMVIRWWMILHDDGGHGHHGGRGRPGDATDCLVRVREIPIFGALE
jgi:hypothetical protein